MIKPWQLTCILAGASGFCATLFGLSGDCPAASGFGISTVAWMLLSFAERRCDRLEASRLKHIDFLNGKYGPGKVLPRS